MTRSRNGLAGGLPTVGASFLWLAAACGGGQAPPDPGRATPSPRKVVLEIDRMKDTPPVELEQTINGRQVSLKSIYAEAGIELEVRQDQVDLPRQDEVSLADLHAMMGAFRSIEAPPDVMRVHALVLTRDREDPDTLGVMFDFGEDDVDGRPREGFAIFADPHARLPGGLQPELLLTMAHELAHCFNLHHPDWEGKSFRAESTVEGYSQADSVRWTLSEHSKTHIRNDPGREVWPGRSNIGFGLITQGHLARHNASPSETFRVVEPGSFNQRRPGATLASALKQAAQRDRSGFLAADRHPVKLRLEAPKASYVVGEPVVLTVGLHNTGQTNQWVLPLLDPKYRFLNVDVRHPGDADFEMFPPLVLADARGAKPQILAPGGSIHDEARIFFGADGWVFKEPGQYSVRADYAVPGADGQLTEQSNRLQSNVLDITITEPATRSDRRARDLILDQQQGLFMLLGGGDHLKRGAARLKQAMQDAPAAAQTAAVRLALGTAALNPTINLDTGVESQPRIDEAKRLLGATLKSQELSALSVVQAQAELADTLDGKGRKVEAARVRADTIQRMQRHESTREYIDEIKRPSQPSPQKPPKPPGERRQ